MINIASKRFYYLLEGFFIAVIGVLILILAGLYAKDAQCIYGVLFLIAGIVLGFRSLFTFKITGNALSMLEAIVLIVAGIVLFSSDYTRNTLMWFLTIWLWVQAALFFIESMARLKSSNWGFLFITSLLFAFIGFMLMIQPTTVSMWSISVLTGGAVIIYGACQFLTGATA